MARYIVIEKNLGVFVGAFDKYAVYAKNDIFGLDRVASFPTRDKAEECVRDYLNKDGKEFDVVEIDTQNGWVMVTDIIRGGYGKYTHRMMDNIPMISTQIH
jgi:hypothetical protein